MDKIIKTNLITVSELYKQLKSNGVTIGRDKLYELTKQRNFPSMKIGKRTYILADKVDEYFIRQANNYYDR